MKNLRQELELNLCGQEVTLKINFHLIEIVEINLGTLADIAVSDKLVNNPKRYEIAAIMADWAHSDKLKKSEIRECVMTASQELLMTYIGAIQGVVLYTLNYIDEKSLNRLTEGKDLDQGDTEVDNVDESGNPI